MSNKMFERKLKRIEKRGECQKAKQELVDKYAKYYPSKRRKVSNIMLVVIVSAITIYTVANFWITYTTGASIDSTLTTCFYAFWASELVALATLKTSKIIKGVDSKNENNTISYEEDATMDISEDEELEEDNMD